MNECMCVWVVVRVDECTDMWMVARDEWICGWLPGMNEYVDGCQGVRMNACMEMCVVAGVYE